MEIPLVPNRLLANKTLPYPIAPQKWHFRQSVEYSLTANRAVLDLASRYRETLLYNIWRMGQNSIERGSRDHWTVTPKRLAALEAAIAKERGGRQATDGEAGEEFERRPRQTPPVPMKFYDLTRDPALRDPRGYILPSSQADFLTATKFVNILRKNGITVHRARADFEAEGKRYAAGSYVVKTAQAFRPFVLDMFEPQDHPHDFRYPGGPPVPPYDITGWTVAWQMGIEFDRILEGFDGPFDKIEGLVRPPAGRVTGQPGAAGYTFSHQLNDAFVAVNRLLKSGEEVSWLRDGAMYVKARPATRAALEKLASEVGLSFTGVASPPAPEVLKLRRVRVALWDRYGGSMPSGWVRWLLEQYEFPFQVVYPQELDAGDLASKFDVLVLASGAFASSPQPPAEQVEPAYRSWLGSVTAAQTVPKLKEFLEAGGTIVTIGTSTSLARHLGLPLSSALVERTAIGERPLGRDKFYIPGSLLSARVDNTHPLAWGMRERADVMYDNSPAFRLGPEAALRGVRAVGWFDSRDPLRSGWAWGQHYLEGAVAMAEAHVGRGRLFLLGPEVTFRGQPHGTFKLLFNGIYYGPAAAE
jgi:hypothetical protein